MNALNGKPLPIYGDGQQVRDWLYVTDHCEAIWTVIERGAVGETYNVGGRNEQRNIDVVRQICALLDARRPDPAGPHERLITFVTDRPGHDLRYAIAWDRLAALGWVPRVELDDGLAETVTWFRDMAPKGVAR